MGIPPSANPSLAPSIAASKNKSIRYSSASAGVFSMPIKQAVADLTRAKLQAGRSFRQFWNSVTRGVR
jgi:hypothetical protein